MNPQLPWKERAGAALREAGFYTRWYPRQSVLLPASVPKDFHRKIAPHLHYGAAASRRLVRAIFHAMARFGPKLERQQMLLGRFADIGTELFAMAATCSRAQMLAGKGTAEDVVALADYFCRTSRVRTEQHFDGVRKNTDAIGYRLAQQMLAGRYKWLKEEIVGALEAK